MNEDVEVSGVGGGETVSDWTQVHAVSSTGLGSHQQTNPGWLSGKSQSGHSHAGAVVLWATLLVCVSERPWPAPRCWLWSLAGPDYASLEVLVCSSRPGENPWTPRGHGRTQDPGDRDESFFCQGLFP